MGLLLWAGVFVVFFVVMTMLQRRFFPEMSKPDRVKYVPLGKQRSPKGAELADAADPLSQTAAYQIIPGEKIGPFQLNASWESIDAMLTEVYEEFDSGAVLTMMAKPLTFEIDPATRQVVAMTAWSGFEGTLLGRIRIGNSLAAVKQALNCRIVRDPRRKDVVPDRIGGVSFLIEGGWFEGWKGESALRHEIGAIRIFPKPDTAPEPPVSDGAGDIEYY